MRKVAIYGHVYKKEQQKYIQTLFHELDKKDIHILVNNEYAEAIENEGYNFITKYERFHTDKLDNSFHTLITLGGDGTILRALTFIKELSIPLLGINLGRLGFLATIQKDEISRAIKSFIKEDYTIVERTLLQVRSTNTGDFSEVDFALNDLTVTKKNTTSMIGVEAYLNEEYLTTYYADGLIISTPSGSTGYSLSCQGPVVMPNSQNFIITPIAPHNLNARPIIIPDNTKIRLKVIPREDEYLASLDTRVSTLSIDSEIEIQKASFSAKIIQLKGESFINTLRSKLLWGEDTRNTQIK